MGLPPEYAPGALAQHSQARKWKRTGCNFREARAQWPGGNLDPPLRFCAPEILCQTLRDNPRKWGPGKAVLWT